MKGMLQASPLCAHTGHLSVQGRILKADMIPFEPYGLIG